jgi:hypothetical protein
VVAVHLRRRRDQHALAEPVAVLEHHFGPLQVGHERVHGLLDDQAHADGRCEVEDDVDLVHELVDDRRVEDGVDDEMEVPPARQVLDVVDRAGREVVEHPDLVAVGEQQLGEMGSDEPGAAGN